MRTVFTLNGGPRSLGGGSSIGSTPSASQQPTPNHHHHHHTEGEGEEAARHHQHMRRDQHANIHTASAHAHLASPPAHSTNPAHHQQQQQPRCYKRLGFDAATRPTAMQPATSGLLLHSPAGGQLHAAGGDASMEHDATPDGHQRLHAHSDDALMLPSPSLGHLPSSTDAAFASAAFAFPGTTSVGLPSQSLSVTASPVRPFHHSSDAHSACDVDAPSPSPFLPAGSPSPSLSSMALARSPPIGGSQLHHRSHSAAHRASTSASPTSPLFTQPSMFSPEIALANSTAHMATNGVATPVPTTTPTMNPLEMSPADSEKTEGGARTHSAAINKGVPQFTTAIAADSRLSQPQPLQPKEKRASGSAKESAAPAGMVTPKAERHSSRISAAERKAAELAAQAPSPVDSPPSSGANGAGGCKGCNCKKSRCLKLYCECFARQGYCTSDCRCNLCQNVPGEQHADDRQKAIQQTLDRDPRAFFRSAEEVIRSCHCKKSACQKKYCECFQAGLPCTEACKCVECKNGRPHTHDDDEEESPSATLKSAGKKKHASGGSGATAASGGGSERVASMRKRKALASTNGSGSSGITTGGDKLLSRSEATAAALKAAEEYERINEKYKKHAATKGGGDSSTTTPDIHASRSSQRDRHAAQRLKESHGLVDDDGSSSVRASPVGGATLSPATASSSNASSTIGSTPHQVTTTMMGSRTMAQPPPGMVRHTLVIGGIGQNGMSFQAQLAAHQASQAQMKGHHSMEDTLETDSDFTSCADSLHEVPHGGVLHTPVKQLRPPVKRNGRATGGDLGGGDANLSALETLVEVASPSPRINHFQRHHSLMSPVSPMGGLGIQTPNAKLTHRALTFNAASGASPLPPLFSPLRNSQQMSPFPMSQSGSVSPAMGGNLNTVLLQQHALAHSQGPPYHANSAYKLVPHVPSTFLSASSRANSNQRASTTPPLHGGTAGEEAKRQPMSLTT